MYKEQCIVVNLIGGPGVGFFNFYSYLYENVNHEEKFNKKLSEVQM
jgi:hypothetical protein